MLGDALGPGGRAGGSSFLSAAEPVIAPALQPFVDRHTLAGAVTPRRRAASKCSTCRDGGLCRRGREAADDPETMFWIASMTKPITATGLMMLVDEGKVKLDDPVEKYLPAFKGQMVLVEQSEDKVVLRKPTRPGVGARRAPAHRRLDRPGAARRKLDYLPLNEAAALYGASPIKFDPGTKYEYNNPGINTAGRIIEVVTERPYDVYMQHRLFEPLGMKDTTFVLIGDQDDRLAKSYRPNNEKNGLEEMQIRAADLSAQLIRIATTSPAAGSSRRPPTLRPSSAQMILNHGMHDGKRFLSEAAIREMTSTQTGDLLNQGKGEGATAWAGQTTRKSPGESGPVIPGSTGHGRGLQHQHDHRPRARAGDDLSGAARRVRQRRRRQAAADVP